MKCPECNHQNPDDAAICEKCYLNFSLVRTSKLAILSMILGLSSLLLFAITGIPAIILGIISIIRIKRSKGKLKGKTIALAGIIIPLLFNSIFFMLWRVDAPPIPNDYTMADLRSAPAEYEESYHLLENLVDLLEDNSINPDANEPLLTKEDMNIIDIAAGTSESNQDTELNDILNKNADTINQIWEKTQKARNIILQLNEFPEIADLHTPNIMTESLEIMPLIDFNKVYIAYSNIQTEANDIFKFSNELIIFDSVVRKLNLNARSLIDKMICRIILSRNITIANSIANKPETSKESLDLLVNHFIPITKEQMSLKNPIIFQYLTFKDSIATSPEENLSKKLSILKVNSTFRVIKNRFDDLLNTQKENNNLQENKLSAWPSFYPFKEPVFLENTEDYLLSPFSLYTWYNPSGSAIIKVIYNEQYSRNQDSFIKLKKIDDLLQIVLSKRLGKDLDLSTLAYGDEYIIDIENKKIFSPGRDGIKDTKDDITLPLNPEVLHLSE